MGQMCCMCECDCRYAGLRRTIQRRLGHRTQQDVLYFLLQRLILFTPKSAIPLFLQSRPQKFLRPFLVWPISLQSTKCSVMGVFPNSKMNVRLTSLCVIKCMKNKMQSEQNIMKTWSVCSLAEVTLICGISITYTDASDMVPARTIVTLHPGTERLDCYVDV